MKKLLLLIAVLITICSCSIDDGPRQQFHLEFLPVESVDVPDHFVRGQNYDIKVYYRRPNDCYYYDDFYYEANGNTRTVAVQSIVIEDANCEPITDAAPEEASFNFLCANIYTNTSYLFKFYKGTDAEGNQEFLEVEVPVTDQ